MRKARITGTDLRILLLRKHLSHAKIAARIGMSKQAVTKTFAGELCNPDTRKKIAAVLRMKVQDIWVA